MRQVDSERAGHFLKQTNFVGFHPSLRILLFTKTEAIVIEEQNELAEAWKLL